MRNECVATFGHLLGVERQLYENGTARYLLPARPELNNGWGIIHGGAIIALLDIALGSAAYTVVDSATEGVVTIDLHTQFISPGVGKLIGEGRVVKTGRRIIFCEGEVKNEKGEIVAKAIGTFKVKRQHHKEGALVPADV